MEQTTQRSFRVTLEELKKVIVERKTKIRSTIAENDLIEGQVLDEGGKAEANSRMGVNVELCEQSTQTLKRIEAALARIDAGTFGDCLMCEEQISLRRLQAIPYAILCKPCQEKAENRPQSRSDGRVALGNPEEPDEEIPGRKRRASVS